MKETRLLPTGSTIPILSGSEYIHSLFHLETPSVTVVIRTHHNPGSGPQFTYLPPHLAVDPFHNDALTTRRKQLLDVLEKTDDVSYPALVLEMIGELDFERGFFILQNGIARLRSGGDWEEIWAAFGEKHGGLAEYVAPTLDEIVRRDGLVGLRSSVTDAEHRFFLALLLNEPPLADILSFISQRVSEDPIEAIGRWTRELSITSGDSTWILDMEFPKRLGVPLEDQSECLAAAVCYFLRGGKGAFQCGSGSLSPKKLEQLRDTLARSSFRALVPARAA